MNISIGMKVSSTIREYHNSLKDMLILSKQYEIAKVKIRKHHKCHLMDKAMALYIPFKTQGIEQNVIDVNTIQSLYC